MEVLGLRQEVSAANTWKGPGGRPGAPETPGVTGEAEEWAVLAPLGKKVQQGKAKQAEMVLVKERRK